MLHTLLILLLPASFVAGQGATPAMGLIAPSRNSADQLSGARWGQIRARLLRIRADRLQQSLGISKEKARSIADQWGQFDLVNQGYLQHSRDLHEQIQSILLGPVSEEDKNSTLQPLVERLADLRQQQADAKRFFEQYLRSSLTPAQQGRFLLVAEEIQQSLRSILKN